VLARAQEDLTIVCATHNGINRIPLLINSIKKNVVSPKEIIICGTDKLDISLVDESVLRENKVSFIVSTVANQVHQRNLALFKVDTDYILQLDDDYILNRCAIGNYVRHFKGPNSNKKVVSGYVVSPNGDHMSYRTKSLYNSSLFVRAFFYIVNGFKEVSNMSILKSGRIFPLVLEDLESIEPEWLPSSLMFHKDAIDKKILLDVKNNGIKGKAYYEDVFFTVLLRKRGFKLILDKNIILTHPYTSSIKPREYIKTISRQKQLVESTKGSYLLFYLDVFLSISFYSILHIRSKLTTRR
jgi:hypothetical protein